MTFGQLVAIVIGNICGENLLDSKDGIPHQSPF